MAMFSKLMAWHDGRPSTSNAGKDPTSAGILSGQEVQELLSVWVVNHADLVGRAEFVLV